MNFAERSLTSLLAACGLNENKNDIDEADVNKFINDYFSAEAKLSHKEMVEQSITDDPWNPLFDVVKKREQINSSLFAKQKMLEELEQEHKMMKAEPMLFSKGDWARHRLKMKLYQKQMTKATIDS